MSETSWEQLSDALAARIPQLQEADVIVLASGGYFTQLMQGREGLAVEAGLDRALPRLDAEQEDAMRAKGWQTPEPPLQHNWSHDVDTWPLHSRDAAKIAELMVATLREVYGVDDPAQIDQSSFNAHQ